MRTLLPGLPPFSMIITRIIYLRNTSLGTYKKYTHLQWLTGKHIIGNIQEIYSFTMVDWKTHHWEHTKNIFIYHGWLENTSLGTYKKYTHLPWLTGKHYPCSSMILVKFKQFTTGRHSTSICIEHTHTCTDANSQIRARARAHTRASARAHTRASKRAHTRASKRAHIHTRARAHTSTRKQAHTQAHASKRTHTSARKRTSARTHAHTFPRA